MNVLLSSVGRRAYMVKYFKEAIGENGRIHICNSDNKTVAFHYADKAVVSPLIYDESYIPFLLEYCKKNQIDILVSLFDIDLPILARNKARFASNGTKVIVSDEKVIEVCNDKWKTYLFLRENGFHVPKTYKSLQRAMQALENGELHYPIVVKPRFGCGSIGISIAENEMALMYCFTRNTRMLSQTYLKYESESVDAGEQLLYQEYLSGQEYGADVINDLKGALRSIIVKKKIAMRAGETDIAEIAVVPAISEELSRLSELTKHIANMDCDIFLAEGIPYILELNARFGGGYPFSHMGGCNLPKAIVEWCKGNEISAEMLSAKSGDIIYKELYLTKSRTEASQL